MNIKQYNQRIADKFPEENLIVLDYSRMDKGCKIQCIDCETVYEFVRGDSPLKKEKTTLCKKCNLTPQQKETKRKVDYWFKKMGHKKYTSYKVFSYDKILVACKFCGKESYKSFADLSKNKGCLCQTSNRLIDDSDFQAEIKSIYGDNFIPLESYQGRFKRIKFRHKCGFIREIVPKSLIEESTGCPKCGKNISLGEIKVQDFLQENNIHFIP